MSEKEIQALISLIDDPDDMIYQQVKEKIIAYGENIIPHLENMWENNSFGTLFQERVEDIIHKIQYDNVYASMLKWRKEGGIDLLEGAITVAKYQYPDLDELDVKNSILKIRQDIWLELNDNLTALEKITIFNQIIFTTHGLTGNKVNYHAPQNSFINNVLESKKGNPLLLSIIYIVLAESLDVPIYGVNLPNHFILAYLDQYNIVKLIEKEIAKANEPRKTDTDVLFYINPFSNGAILHTTEITNFLKHLKLDPKPEFYNPCSNVSIIKRLLNNLIFSYDKLGYPDKVAEIKELLTALYIPGAD
jgi:hypothetical protein